MYTLYTVYTMRYIPVACTHTHSRVAQLIFSDPFSLGEFQLFVICCLLALQQCISVEEDTIQANCVVRLSVE